MAKQVKVFNGTTSTSTSIYSVPAGRVARVEVASLTGNSISGNIEIYAGSIPMFVIGFTSSFFIPSLGASVPSITGSDTNLVGVVAGGASISARRYAYLTAGQSISIYNPYSGSLTYNFCVVEEY